MEIIVILIILSLVLGGSFLALFIWSVKDGQMDDLKSPAIRILEEVKEK